MGISVADYLAMQERLRHKPAPVACVNCGPSESALQEQIEAWLKSLGTECYYVRSRMDKATTNRVGTPDFMGCILINGRGVPWALEVKRAGRKETTEQAGQLLWLKLAGAHVLIVRSLQETMDFFAGLKKP